ncbi:flagellar FliJ family protein [Microbacterium sp. NPDC028030]|uniref:flagellar FliJ family protein n=1 Tax=Microbacterium sp. NPDC028030 TaxID=3155124 RepID=UPI0033D8CC31
MTRSFSLAGLLRVRGIQERAAAQRLSRAVIDAQHTEARDRLLRAHLTGTGSEAVDVRSLAALAAARVAGRTLLADLSTLSELQEQTVDQAREEHAEARRAVRGLDRLAEAHAAEARAADRHAEQAELDEIGSRTGAEEPS